MTADPTGNDRAGAMADVAEDALTVESERAKSAATRDVEAAMAATEQPKPPTRATTAKTPELEANEPGSGEAVPRKRRPKKPRPPQRRGSDGKFVRKTAPDIDVADSTEAKDDREMPQAEAEARTVEEAVVEARPVETAGAETEKQDAPRDVVKVVSIERTEGEDAPKLAITNGRKPGPKVATPAQNAVLLDDLVTSRAEVPAAAALVEGPTDDLGEWVADKRTEEPTGKSEAKGGLLAGVLIGEPPVGEGVAAVYRRAEKLRRRRVRRVVAAGLVSAVVVAAFGYALATAVIPTPYLRMQPATPVAGPDPVVDPVLVTLEPVLRDNGLRAVRREPSAGEGWRQYAVADAKSGRPRGLIEVAAYLAPDGLCFPVLREREACARPMGGGDVEYARYSDDRDVDWQVQEAMARRLSDGRVVAVMATGERGTGRRADGRPPLTAAQVARVAVDVRVMSAFDPDEQCTGPDAACPVLKVPVPTSR